MSSGGTKYVTLPMGHDTTPVGSVAPPGFGAAASPPSGGGGIATPPAAEAPAAE